MTSQDNLQDRIAAAILAETKAGIREREGELVPDIPEFQDAMSGRFAQAVIDGFGLRWEHQPVIGGTRKRVIGDWKGGKEGTKK